MLGCMLKASCFQVPVMLPPLEVLMFSWYKAQMWKCERHTLCEKMAQHN
jgi:hypothetical protein